MGRSLRAKQHHCQLPTLQAWPHRQSLPSRMACKCQNPRRHQPRMIHKPPHWCRGVWRTALPCPQDNRLGCGTRRQSRGLSSTSCTPPGLMAECGSLVPPRLGSGTWPLLQTRSGRACPRGMACSRCRAGRSRWHRRNLRPRSCRLPATAPRPRAEGPSSSTHLGAWWTSGCTSSKLCCLPRLRRSQPDRASKLLSQCCC
mmetsp:Transcript_95304/g.308718  ORF Transcript_95304/g.308718 Transcript_95304/m.308718 type:complete len:200 (-) Transcript_95304:1809-2408(-)